MLRMLWIDLKKMFGNYRFYVGTIGIAMGLMLNAAEELAYGGGKSGAENMFLGARGNGLVLLSFMLCIIGGALSFCDEQKNGNIRLLAVRSRIEPYVKAKVISAAVGGWLCMFLGLFLSVAGMALMILAAGKGQWIIFQGGKDLTEMFFLITANSFLGALLSVIGLAVTTILPNYFMGMSAPILIYYLWLNLDGWFGFSPYLDMSCYFYYDPKVWSTWYWQLVYAFLFTGAVSWMLYGICRYMIKRRLEND